MADRAQLDETATPHLGQVMGAVETRERIVA
jgi:hypothetical protein